MGVGWVDWRGEIGSCLWRVGYLRVVFLSGVWYL